METNTLKCPVCRRAVATREHNPCFPFCTERCRTIDLGRWFGGEYRIAVASADEDDDGDTSPERKPLDS